MPIDERPLTAERVRALLRARARTASRGLGVPVNDLIQLAYRDRFLSRLLEIGRVVRFTEDHTRILIRMVNRGTINYEGTVSMPGTHQRGKPVPGELGGETVARFIANLKVAVAERSVADVADRAGLTTRELRELMAGEFNPGVDVIQALEQALRVDLWPRRSNLADTSTPGTELAPRDG